MDFWFDDFAKLANEPPANIEEWRELARDVFVICGRNERPHPWLISAEEAATILKAHGGRLEGEWRPVMLNGKYGDGLMPDVKESNAFVTGDYVITPYRCDQAVALDRDERCRPSVVFERLVCVGDGKEVCVLDRSEGNWWYSLNDGLLDVGRFASREAAIEDATRSIKQYHSDMGGSVRSISVADGK